MNTRFDILLTYTPNRIRDSWILTGQQVLTESAKVFTRNTLFQLNHSVLTTPLQGYLLFVAEDFTDTSFSWTDWAVNDLADGTIIREGVIHPSLRVVLTADELSTIPEPFDPTFVPFEETTTSQVKISDEELDLILLELGVPFLKEEDLEFTKDEILQLMVLPAIKEYYKWYPIVRVESQLLTANKFEVPIPNYAFTALRAFVNNDYAVSAIGNPVYRYFDEALMSGSRGSFPGTGTRRRRGYRDVDSYSTYIMERAVRQGIVNYGTRTRIRVYIQAGVVKGYSNKRGVLEIEWGCMSYDWADIPFTRLSEVRTLARAYVLRAFAQLRSQARSDLPGGINYEGLLTRSKELEDSIIETWRSSTKSVVVRSS